MYKDFYGLTAIPFNITSYPKLPPLSPHHEEGQLRLLNGITQRKGLIILTGEIGTGKTNLLNSLVNKLDQKTRTAFVIDSRLSIMDVMRCAFHDWKIGAVDEPGFKDGLYVKLNKFLAECGEKGENVLLIIDEAQNLPRGTLEELFHLAQLNDGKETLLQIILSGQVEFESELSTAESNRPKPPIGLMYRLRPLTYDETKSYIEKSLIASGAKYPIFTSDAIQAIYTYSKGIPRAISALADLALLSGFIDQQREVGGSIILRVAEKLDYRASTRSAAPDSGKRGDPVASPRSPAGLPGGGKGRFQKGFRRPVAAIAAGLVVGGLCFMLFIRFVPAFAPWPGNVPSAPGASLRPAPDHPPSPEFKQTPSSATVPPAAAPVPNPAGQKQFERPLSPADSGGATEEKSQLQAQKEALEAENLAPDAIRGIDLAKSLSAQGNYAEAEILYQRALAVQEQIHGPEDPGLASLLGNLAGVYYILGKHAKAEALYRRLLSLAEKRFGPEDPQVAAGLNNLAVLYETQGRYAEAEGLYRRALVIKENALGPDHPGLATSLNNLAVACKTQGRYAEAEGLYRRALVIKEKALGPDNPGLATSLSNLAVLYRIQGRYDEAEPLYRRALALKEKALGPDHPELATSLSNLAVLHHSRGRYAEAEPLYRRALTMDEKRLGPDHPDVATDLENYAALLRNTNRKAEAEALEARAQKIRALNKR